MKKLKQILLIDDDKATNFLNARLLSSLEIAEEVKVLTDGQLAYDYLTRRWQTNPNSPELVILDHHMPVMDGKKLMQLLNKEGLLERVEVVYLLLAIASSKEDIKHFKELGVQEFTSKPLSKETVMDAYKKYWAGDTVNNHRSDG
ncbi:response regulator [Pontibacter silvestris]|uniref:Response regulator n=1 Tax=Pontibacter silvestris TaxID=2305183 RepID=A0ABW4WVZ5_9BACT|nr:response regulator [Pontibacter silvestris]MCC9137012.1 response regulator [Pontibacter silvestris]